MNMQLKRFSAVLAAVVTAMATSCVDYAAAQHGGGFGCTRWDPCGDQESRGPSKEARKSWEKMWNELFAKGTDFLRTEDIKGIWMGQIVFADGNRDLEALQVAFTPLTDEQAQVEVSWKYCNRSWREAQSLCTLEQAENFDKSWVFQGHEKVPHSAVGALDPTERAFRVEFFTGRVLNRLSVRRMADKLIAKFEFLSGKKYETQGFLVLSNRAKSNAFSDSARHFGNHLPKMITGTAKGF